MPWKVNFANPLSADIVEHLGVDAALRLISTVTRRLRERADEFRSNRDPGELGCFLIRVRPFIVPRQGGWYDCLFSVNDQKPEVLIVSNWAYEFRLIGPLGFRSVENG